MLETRTSLNYTQAIQGAVANQRTLRSKLTGGYKGLFHVCTQNRRQLDDNTSSRKIKETGVCMNGTLWELMNSQKQDIPLTDDKQRQAVALGDTCSANAHINRWMFQCMQCTPAIQCQWCNTKYMETRSTVVAWTKLQRQGQTLHNRHPTGGWQAIVLLPFPKSDGSQATVHRMDDVQRPSRSAQ